jgi:excisionase family DNA binding protein
LAAGSDSRDSLDPFETTGLVIVRTQQVVPEPAPKEQMMLNRDSGGHVTGKLLLTAEEAAEVLGISRTSLYRLLAQSALPSVKIGASRRIPFGALTDYVDRALAEASG